MAIELQIFDGNPWWLSPDIWVVPGDNPEGFPGIPIAGNIAYVWARVHNTGSSDVQNATVRFYWADPSVGFDRTSANLIGASNVTLGAGQTSDVLCLAPWVPSLVNDGHECVLAEAFHPSDPLPLMADFNAPSDRHVAQRNLTVLAAKAKMFALRFLVHNTWRTERKFNLGIKKGKIDELRPLVKTLGRINIPPKDGELQSAGFLRDRCPSEQEIKHAPADVDVVVRPHGQTELTLVGQVGPGGSLIHIVQSVAGKVTGGLSVVIVS